MTQRTEARSVTVRAVDARLLRDWFTEASRATKRGVPIPDDAAIDRAAILLTNYAPRDLAQPNWKSVSAANKFMKAIKDDAADMLAVLHELPPSDCAELLRGRDTATAAVADFLRLFAFPDLQTTWHDAAAWVDYVAAQAWADAGKPPKSYDPAGARVAFVLCVLEYWRVQGDDKAISTGSISKALRGERVKFGAAYLRMGDRLRGKS